HGRRQGGRVHGISAADRTGRSRVDAEEPQGLRELRRSTDAASRSSASARRQLPRVGCRAMTVRKWLIVVIAVLFLIVAGISVLALQVLGSDLVRSQIEKQLSSYLGQPVHIASASTAIFPRIAIDLHDFTIGKPAAVQLGRVRLVTGLRGLLSRRVEDAAI